MESNNFDKMYNVVPEDATVEFELDYKKQNAYVQEMMKENNIEWTNTNQIAFTPRVDLAKVGTLKVDMAFTDVVDLKYNNPALATNDQIKIIDLINALNVKATEASYKKWTNLTLKDAVGNTLVKYNATTIAAEETIAETLYRKDAAGNAVAEATGLEISLDENEKDFTYDAATATLTWKGTPEGTVYTHDVNLNITYTHNWGVVTKTFKVTVTRKVQ